MTTHVKATEQFFPVLKLVMSYKEFQTSVWVKPLGETVSKKAAKRFRPCAFQFGVLFEILKSSNENSKGLPPSPNKICVRWCVDLNFLEISRSQFSNIFSLVGCFPSFFVPDFLYCYCSSGIVSKTTTTVARCFGDQFVVLSFDFIV